MLSLRRKTPQVMIGNVPLGHRHIVVIQTMTNTVTSDVMQTVKQVQELSDSGAQLVRLTINDDRAMRSIPEIIQRLEDDGYSIPLIGDFHFNGHLLLKKWPKSAGLLAKYRINPGNVGQSAIKDKNFASIVKIAIENNKPVRIGVNGGSLDRELLSGLMKKNASLKKPKPFSDVVCEAAVQSALLSARKAQQLGMAADKIVLSVKMSDAQELIKANEILASRCEYVLHVGLTEAGASLQGIVSSSAALGILLQQGIGDTIRISLTPTPGASRTEEVKVCQHLLQSLNIQAFRPTIISCPGCGRTDLDVFPVYVQHIQKFVDTRYKEWTLICSGIEKLRIAVMGCVVNGPGESMAADIGICIPGKTEAPIGQVYGKGKLIKKLKGPRIMENFCEFLEEFVKKAYGKSL
ncbi:flavodoxin-dependent (E)-4-hydroxy-3-methylbut-2-enyl-diphosphate synthase [Candidatus Margulisiibacteriota bacterium]